MEPSTPSRTALSFLLMNEEHFIDTEDDEYDKVLSSLQEQQLSSTPEDGLQSLPGKASGLRRRLYRPMQKPIKAKFLKPNQVNDISLHGER